MNADDQAAHGRAEQLLDAEQLDVLKSDPATECERCRAPFNGNRYLLEITGHYVSGTAWELCTACTGDVYGWLGGEPDVIPPIKSPSPTAPIPRRRHQ